MLGIWADWALIVETLLHYHLEAIFKRLGILAALLDSPEIQL